MPTSPKPEAKTAQVCVKAKPGQEEFIRAFKELCLRNRLEMQGELMELIKSWLKTHNWPPGNSQTALKSFGFKKSIKCSRCGGSFNNVWRVETVGGVLDLCKSCLEWCRKKQLDKKVLRLL